MGSGVTYKMDIIGYDACLMSMYEIAAAMAPYGRYLLGSEILEPGQGWDYSATGNMTAMAGAGQALGPVDVGTLWVQAYMLYGLESGSVGLTLALSDLGAQGQLQQDVTALARSLTLMLQGPSGNSEFLLCLVRLGWCACSSRVGVLFRWDWGVGWRCWAWGCRNC